MYTSFLTHVYIARHQSKKNLRDFLNIVVNWSDFIRSNFIWIFVTHRKNDTSRKVPGNLLIIAVKWSYFYVFWSNFNWIFVTHHRNETSHTVHGIASSL